MTWDNEPPTNPPQSGEPANPFAPPDASRASDAEPPTPAADDPTVEATNPFRPAPTAEVPPPPPPIPPLTSSYPPPAEPAPSTPPTAPGAYPAPSVPADPWGAPAAPVPPGGFGGPPTPPPLPPSSSPAPTRPNRAVRALVGLVVLVGLFGLGFGVRSLVDDDPEPSVQDASQVSIPEAAIDPGDEPVAAVAQAIGPSVVQIRTDSGLGSGVVYDDGLIITNAHVVGSSTDVKVISASGDTVDGEVLGTDTGTDIAVVRAPGLDVPAAVLATGTKPAVGQIAVAVGSPYGLDQTVTSGIVSAVNRPVDNDKGVVVNMVQTDASINPGNSGGALANREGQIIGINTAIFSQTGENTGIGFAIPIATAKKAADQLVNGESVAKAGLGLTCSTPCQNTDGDAGARVEDVTEGSAAAAAGIEAGDVIVSVDGTDIRSFEELRGLISSHSPGETVTITVERDGETKDIEVTLGTLGNGTTPTTEN